MMNPVPLRDVIETFFCIHVFLFHRFQYGERKMLFRFQPFGTSNFVGGRTLAERRKLFDGEALQFSMALEALQQACHLEHVTKIAVVEVQDALCFFLK